MTYNEWDKANEVKRDSVLSMLPALSVDELVTYFSYDNMKVSQPDFCGLYKDSKKCHDIAELNCYNCGCPYFFYNDEGISIQDGITVYSTCTINAKEGSKFKSDTAIHQDCSNCTIPHTPVFTRKELIKNKFTKDP